MGNAKMKSSEKYIELFNEHPWCGITEINASNNSSNKYVNVSNWILKTGLKKEIAKSGVMLNIFRISNYLG